MKQFVSSDLGFSGSLRALGFSMLEVRPSDGKRFEFVFEDDGRIEETEKLFWAGRLPIDALAYFNAIKVLKSLIHLNRN